MSEVSESPQASVKPRSRGPVVIGLLALTALAAVGLWQREALRARFAVLLRPSAEDIQRRYSAGDRGVRDKILIELHGFPKEPQHQDLEGLPLEPVRDDVRLELSAVAKHIGETSPVMALLAAGYGVRELKTRPGAASDAGVVPLLTAIHSRVKKRRRRSKAPKPPTPSTVLASVLVPLDSALLKGFREPLEAMPKSVRAAVIDGFLNSGDTSVTAGIGALWSGVGTKARAGLLDRTRWLKADSKATLGLRQPLAGWLRSGCPGEETLLEPVLQRIRERPQVFRAAMAAVPGAMSPEHGERTMKLVQTLSTATLAEARLGRTELLDVIAGVPDIQVPTPGGRRKQVALRFIATMVLTDCSVVGRGEAKSRARALLKRFPEQVKELERVTLEQKQRKHAEAVRKLWQERAAHRFKPEGSKAAGDLDRLLRDWRESGSSLTVYGRFLETGKDARPRTDADRITVVRGKALDYVLLSERGLAGDKDLRADTVASCQQFQLLPLPGRMSRQRFKHIVYRSGRGTSSRQEATDMPISYLVEEWTRVSDRLKGTVKALPKTAGGGLRFELVNDDQSFTLTFRNGAPVMVIVRLLGGLEYHEAILPAPPFEASDPLTWFEQGRGEPRWVSSEAKALWQKHQTRFSKAKALKWIKGEGAHATVTYIQGDKFARLGCHPRIVEVPQDASPMDIIHDGKRTMRVTFIKGVTPMRQVSPGDELYPFHPLLQALARGTLNDYWTLEEATAGDKVDTFVWRNGVDRYRATFAKDSRDITMDGYLDDMRLRVTFNPTIDPKTFDTTPVALEEALKRPR